MLRLVLYIKRTSEKEDKQVQLIEPAKSASDLFCHQAMWVALVEQKMIGIRTCLKMLLDGFSIEDIWHADETLLKQYIRQTDKRRRFLSITATAQVGVLKEAEQFVTACFEKGVQILPIDSPEYPALLREIYDPPLILYVRGQISALGKNTLDRTLAVVGTRRMSEYGKQVTQKLVAECAPYYPSIISGLADGVDAEAHRTAIMCHLPTVAVFGCGIDRIFPSFHQKLAQQILDSQGALISEWPPGYPGDKYTFPKRNRIIAGLSEATLVVEGALKSGALITAKTAFEEGRQVFAVPGNIFNPVSQGPLYLIKNGVSPVVSGDEIAEELRWKTSLLGMANNTASSLPLEESLQGQNQEENNQPAQVQNLDSDRYKEQNPSLKAHEKVESLTLCHNNLLLEKIPHDPVSIEFLQETSGLTLPELTEQLTLLELEGVIKCLPGQQFSRLCV